MALPIIEQPLYGEVLIETSPWTTPFVWTDRTADLVAGFNYSQGGRVGTPGSSQVDVGTLNATFKNLASVPAVGAMVRISFSKFAGYAFVGYVQDVSQRIVFDQSVSLTTPITLTTLNCADWVGYIGQFQAVGAGGYSSAGVKNTLSYYDYNERIYALNRIIDSSGSTQLITPFVTSTTFVMGDTDLVGTMAEHLDLVATTAETNWFATNEIPTNTTTGRTGLINLRHNSSNVSSGKTFTDLIGSAGQLHYTEIDFTNSTQNVANTIVLNNRARIELLDDKDLTRIGGFNETNYMVVNNENVIGVPFELQEKATDNTSITTYGNRQAFFETNLAQSPDGVNYLINPSVEYSDDGFGAGPNSQVRRRRPQDDGASIKAFSGEWAIRIRQSAAATTCRANFSGGESDGIPVTPFLNYTFSAYALRATTGNADSQFRIDVNWKNEAEATISTVSSATVAINSSTWTRNVLSLTGAPAGAVRAQIVYVFSRSGGGNIPNGNKFFLDAVMMEKGTSVSDYFDGDTIATTNNSFGWTGGVGESPSIKSNNLVDNLASSTLSRYSTTSIRATRIRWNAQENLTAIPSLSVGKTISLIYDGTTTTYRIVGIDGNVGPERYMIDYYLQKV